jgi:hydroxysqualene dehydroxylase
MIDSKDVVVVGGGFGGLSAGVALAERGFRVALLERKPELGGRAYSFEDPDTGDQVDNGQHVLMGCYSETLDFLRKIGSGNNLVFQKDLEIQMLARPGRSATLRTARLPGPLHMSAALMRYGHLSLKERFAAARGGLRLLKMRRRDRGALERMTVTELMNQLGQSENARRAFWYPLSVATLNDEPEVSSAGLLAEVLMRAFFSRRADSAFVYSRVGLSELYCRAARSFVERAGGVIARRAVVEGLEVDGGGVVERIRLRDGRKLEAANFIVAAQAEQLIRMLPENLVADPFFQRINQLTTSPIICVHAWFDREVTRSAFVGFIGTTTQWLFNKRRIFERHGERHPGYLSFVISGARRLVDLPNDDLLDLVLSDLSAMIPAARHAKVSKAIVLKEKQATMAPTTDSHRLRPGVATPLKNLFLAGDWIQTGLPATIESAVISGRAAAAAVAARA